MFPGANGIANAGGAASQVDKSGAAYATLPPPIDSNLKPAGPDSRFPADLANKPFNIDQYVPLNQKTGDLVHRFYQEQLQINGGKMDKFVAWIDAAGLVISTNSFNHGPAGLVFVLPLTRTDRRIPIHAPLDPPEAGVSARSYILCDALRSIAKDRFGPRPWGGCFGFAPLGSKQNSVHHDAECVRRHLAAPAQEARRSFDALRRRYSSHAPQKLYKMK
jgi:hypothetical protein